MELDANVVNSKNQNILPSQKSSRNLLQRKSISSSGSQTKVNEMDTDVVKCGEAVEDVKIETSEISEKFKFFETYRKPECKKRAFRITPPREEDIKMPSSDENSNDNSIKEMSPDRNIIAHSRTTSMMLNKFREMERNPNSNQNNNSRKPLKCFTPPPDENRRLYVEQDSDEYDSNDDDDDEYDDEEDEGSEIDDENNHNYNHASNLHKDDEALREVCIIRIESKINLLNNKLNS